MKKLTSIMAAIAGVSLSAGAYNIYIDNQMGYEQTALYAWGDLEAFGGWPGATPSGTETVDGRSYLKFECPATADGQGINLIFNNNGNDQQCADYFVTVNQDFYFVAAGSKLIPADEWTGEVPVGHILYVQNESSYNPLNVYAWATDQPELFGGWPGRASFGTETISGVTYEKFQMEPLTNNYNLIFNSNGNQFDGPVINSGADVYMRIGDGTYEILPTPGVEYHYLYIENQTGWDALYVYAWATGEPELFGGWPGEKAEQTTQINDKTYYVIPFPASDKTYNLIFNNNDGTQYDVEAIVCDKDYYYVAESDSFTSSVSAIASENQGDAVYFNLQGVRVANPENGIFIKVTDGRATKIIF